MDSEMLTKTSGWLRGCYSEAGFLAGSAVFRVFGACKVSTGRDPGAQCPSCQVVELGELEEEFGESQLATGDVFVSGAYVDKDGELVLPNGPRGGTPHRQHSHHKLEITLETQPPV